MLDAFDVRETTELVRRSRLKLTVPRGGNGVDVNRPSIVSELLPYRVVDPGLNGTGV